jgi:hypothetical protein
MQHAAEIEFGISALDVAVAHPSDTFVETGHRLQVIDDLCQVHDAEE